METNKTVLNSVLGDNSKLMVKTSRLSKKKALIICVVITLSVMAVEIIYSYVTKSLMLFSDGLHMLSHGLSLGISLIAIIIAAKKATKYYPFGYGRIEVIAALINGIGLLFFTAYIFYESALRIIDPLAINVYETLGIAILGLIVNLFTAWILYQAGLEDLNTKSAFLHLLADTFSSIAIIIGCVIINYTQWYVIDPILSIVVGVVIAKWAIGLLKEAIQLLLNKSPKNINPDKILREIALRYNGTVHLKTMKIWEMQQNEIALAGTLEFSPMSMATSSSISNNLKQWLRENYEISVFFLDWKETEETNELLLAGEAV